MPFFWLDPKNQKIKAVRNPPKTDAAHPLLAKLAIRAEYWLQMYPSIKFLASICPGPNSDQQPCHAMHLFLNGRFRKAKVVRNKNNEHENDM